jgi:ABC-2 type transport system ATP-binding protein
VGIVIDNLTKNYSATKALKGISLRFEQNGVVGLLGPNGAGKTSLMKILTGYLSQWKGTISFDGMDIRTNTKKIQQIIGYLPENNPLYLEMYIKEYLNFVGTLYKLQTPPIEAIIEKTGLQEHAHKKIGDLSKGYKQRVGIAAALLHDPDYLILDEPTTGLDPNQVIEIRTLIKNLGKKKTVFLSTHILQEVDAMCDRVIIINKGEIVLDQALVELRNKQEQIIEVSFDYRIEFDALEKISNVQKVTNTYDFNYELQIKGAQDMRPAVFDFAQDNGLKILNLQLKNESLEQLFKKLTV